MKTLKTFFALFLLFSISSCAVKSARLSTSITKTERFQFLLDSIGQAHPDAIGLMVHIEAPDQNISWSGISNPAVKTSYATLQPDQPLLIASNTKTYVAVAMLRLVEDGKLSLDQTIGPLLSEKTASLFAKEGYLLDKITVAHLLSHTSGIFDYVNADAFFARVESNPKHRWTRAEQLALAISDGAPLGAPGEVFSYADTNFLLLTEIMEQLTGKPFYTAMRDLINYEKLGLKTTWFTTLEEASPGSKTPPCQYWTSMNINSCTLDHSFDLYGGGGIMSNTKDLARFSQLLFSKQLFEKEETLDLLFTKMPTKNGEDNKYYLGLSTSEINGITAYGHGGFWGTVVQYLPKLNTSISVFVLERDQRILRKDILEALVSSLQ